MSKQLQILVGVAMFATLALAGALGIFAFSGAQPVQADSHVTRSFSATQVATGGTVDVDDYQSRRRLPGVCHGDAA